MAEADGLQAGGLHPVFKEVLAHGLGAAFRQGAGDTLKSAKHGSKTKFDEDGDPITPSLRRMFQDWKAIEIDGVKYVPVDPWQRLPFSVDLIRKDIRRLPTRWKPWNNDRVRIMCDASSFVESIRRPQGTKMSFAGWSRSA